MSNANGEIDTQKNQNNIDRRFDAYVSLYNNLDTLLWSLPPFLLGVTILGIGLFGEMLIKPDGHFAFLTHNQSVGFALIIVGFFYGLGVFSMWRIRVHHSLLGEELKNLEPSGYFHKRMKTIKGKFMSAPSVFILFFTIIAIVSIILGIIIFSRKEKPEMKKLILEDIARYGISKKHEKMDNGELRFRLMCDDGSGYIRTVAGKEGSWQNSHFHPNIKEAYIVQKGWLGFAELNSGKLILRRYIENDVFSVMPGIVHNIYLPKEAVIHTVKYGEAKGKEWVENKDLDKLTKVLSEQDIINNTIN